MEDVANTDALADALVRADASPESTQSHLTPGSMTGLPVEHASEANNGSEQSERATMSAERGRCCVYVVGGVARGVAGVVL